MEKFRQTILNLDGVLAPAPGRDHNLLSAGEVAQDGFDNWYCEICHALLEPFSSLCHQWTAWMLSG